VISKPGTVIAASLNKALGAGTDALISADEINEIVSALLGQIAVQALTGAAGLLGLSANVSGGGGSYLDQLNQESFDLVTDSTSGSLEAMDEAAAVQSEFRLVAAQYIPRLQAYVANNQNSLERRGQAQDAYNEAREVVSESQSNLTRINSLRNDYAALEEALTAPNISLEEKRRIAQQQSQILQAFYQINAYTANDIRAARQAWEAALRP
jgi:hypothetical protein